MVDDIEKDPSARADLPWMALKTDYNQEDLNSSLSASLFFHGTSPIGQNTARWHFRIWDKENKVTIWEGSLRDLIRMALLGSLLLDTSLNRDNTKEVSGGRERVSNSS